MLFLGRIHPVKGLDNLLQAWSVVEPSHPNWRLRIVGSDVGYYGQSGYREQLRALCRNLQLERVDFDDELYGEAKLDAYRQAELYVLPSRSENFGITVAEALAAGVPAIATRGTPWQALEQHRCGWCIDVGVEPLVACLQDALACPVELLRDMGRRGRDWMEAEFSWAEVGKRMAMTYQWLLSGKAVPPSWIRLD